MPTTLSDQDEILRSIDRVLPKGLPDDVRDEAKQELVLAVLSGTLMVDALPVVVGKYVRGAWNAARPNPYKLSLDTPSREDEERPHSLIERLGKEDTTAVADDENDVVDVPDEQRLARWVNHRTGSITTRKLRGQWLRCRQCKTSKYVVLSKVSTWKYCSMACRRAGGWHGPKYPHVKRVCAYCGEGFEVSPGVARRYPAKYCSIPCARHAKKGTKRRPIGTGAPCKHCGGLVTIKVRRKQAQLYCSEVCRQAAWHARATKEGRCHWCGKPSLADFRNACAEHERFERANNRRNRKRRLERFTKTGACVVCGRRKAVTGRQKCADCNERYNRASKERRAAARTRVLAGIRARGLITVKEAAERYLFVHPKYVNTLITRGKLRPQKAFGRAFWLDKQEVLALAKARAER